MTSCQIAPLSQRHNARANVVHLQRWKLHRQFRESNAWFTELAESRLVCRHHLQFLQIGSFKESLQRVKYRRDVVMMSYWRRSEVMTSHRHWYNVITTSCSRWDLTVFIMAAHVRSNVVVGSIADIYVFTFDYWGFGIVVTPVFVFVKRHVTAACLIFHVVIKFVKPCFPKLIPGTAFKPLCIVGHAITAVLIFWKFQNENVNEKLYYTAYRNSAPSLIKIFTSYRSWEIFQGDQPSNLTIFFSILGFRWGLSL